MVESPADACRHLNGGLNGVPAKVDDAEHNLFRCEARNSRGRTTRHATQADALSVIGGFTCFMDGTLRDWQRHTSQFLPGKSFERSGAMGPWVVTADEIADPHALTLTTRVDGEVMQHASTSQLIHDLTAIIVYCSTFTTLEPGDVIATGTPGGVGYARDPQVWLVPGSRVEVDISGVGVLANTVVDEPTP